MPKENIIIKQMVNVGAIPVEDEAIYRYGLKQAAIYLCNFLLVVLLGVLLGKVGEMLCFLVSYMAIRSYAGGYHAKTVARCYLMSVLLMVSIAGLMKMTIWDGYFVAGITVICAIIIWLKAPIAAKNKPLSDIEVAIYRRLTRRILLVLIGIEAVLWWMGAESYSLSLMLTMALSAGMLIVREK